MVEIGAGSLQDRRQVAQRTIRLGGDTFGQCAVRRIRPDLTGREHEFAGTDRLAVWADRGRGRVGVDPAASGHASSIQHRPPIIPC